MYAIKSFVPPLHGLRGVAALIVLLSHFGNMGLYLLPVPYERIGKVGVWIFFTLSAYLLTNHLTVALLTGRFNYRPYLSYAIRRVFRIFPLFIISLLIYYAIGDFSLRQLVDHATFQEATGVYWAVVVECKYYLVIPCIAILVASKGERTAILVLAIGLIISIAISFNSQQKLFSEGLELIPRLVPFLVGSLLAILTLADTSEVQRKVAQVVQNPMINYLTLFLFIALITSFKLAIYGQIHSNWLPIISVAISFVTATLIYLSLNDSTIVSKFLGRKWLVFAGKISFSVYLLHMFVLKNGLLQAVWEGLPYSYIKAWATLIIVIGIAWTSYILVEQPGIRIGNKLEKFLFDKPA